MGGRGRFDNLHLRRNPDLGFVRFDAAEPVVFAAFDAKFVHLGPAGKQGFDCAGLNFSA